MSDKFPRVEVTSTSCCTPQRPLNCCTDSVGICGQDAEGNIRKIRTDNTGHLEVTTKDLDIRDLNCDQDSVTMCGEDAQGNTHTIQTDGSGRLDITATDLDIRDLNCDQDSVTTCGSAGVPIRTDNNGNVFANFNRTFVGDFQANLPVATFAQYSTTQDISQVISYVFYLRSSGNGTVVATLQVAPDDTNFFDVQVAIRLTFNGHTGFLPAQKQDTAPIGPLFFNTGYPLPGKKARICYLTPTDDEDAKIDIGFAAWK